MSTLRRSALGAASSVLLMAGIANAEPRVRPPVVPSLTADEVRSFLELRGRGEGILGENGDAGEAASLLEKAILTYRGNEDAWYALACARGRLGQADRAMSALRQALDEGYDRADWPAKDEDLALLHGSPQFEAWLASVRARAPRAPPPLPEIDPALLAQDEPALEAEGRAIVEHLDTLWGFLSNRDMRMARLWTDTWRAASWDRIAESQSEPGEREAAKLAAMKALVGASSFETGEAQAAEILARAADFERTFPTSGLLANVRLLEAQAAHAGRLHVTRDEPLAKRMKPYERDLLVLAATLTEGEVLRETLIEIFAVTDEPAIVPPLYRRLKALSPDPARLRKEIDARFATGADFMAEGLPDFRTVTLDGKEVTPSSLAGKVTLLVFWAKWCGPCRAEIPELKRIHGKHGDRGFEIVGICLDEGDDAKTDVVRGFLAENGMTWPQCVDGKGWKSPTVEAFRVSGVPTMLLLDRQAKVRAYGWQVRFGNLERRVEELLAEPVGSITESR